MVSVNGYICLLLGQIMMAIKLCDKGLQHISVLMQNCNDLSTMWQKGHDLPQNEFKFELYLLRIIVWNREVTFRIFAKLSTWHSTLSNDIKVVLPGMFCLKYICHAFIWNSQISSLCHCDRVTSFVNLEAYQELTIQLY